MSTVLYRPAAPVRLGRLRIVDGCSRCGEYLSDLGVMEPIRRTATFEDGREEELLFCDQECLALFQRGAREMRELAIEDLIGVPIEGDE